MKGKMRLMAVIFWEMKKIFGYRFSVGGRLTFTLAFDLQCSILLGSFLNPNKNINEPTSLNRLCSRAQLFLPISAKFVFQTHERFLSAFSKQAAHSRRVAET